MTSWILSRSMASYSEKVKKRIQNARTAESTLKQLSMEMATTSQLAYEHTPILDQLSIHIYGDTLEGQIIAHSLRRLPSPPNITLLFATTAEMGRWAKSKSITVFRNGLPETTKGFDSELARPPLRRHGRLVTWEERDEKVVDPHWEARKPGPPTKDDPPVPDVNNTNPIKYLILAVPPHAIVPRLQGIMHRLSPDSTILLMHHGLGVLERIAAECWPDPEKRPNLIQGLSTHRLYKRMKSGGDFIVDWYQAGSITVSPLPRFQKTLFEADAFATMEENPISPGTDRLINTMKQCGTLLMNDTSVTDLFLAQLEALAIDCIIQPISALADIRNGQVLYSYHFTSSARLLLTELSLVIRSLPELQSYPNLETRFAPDRLETIIVAQLYKTSMDWSTMVLDIRNGRHTSIDYLNKYLITRGEELGLKCWMNFLILHLIKGKALVVDHEIQAQVPM